MFYKYLLVIEASSSILTTLNTTDTVINFISILIYKLDYLNNYNNY